MPDIKWSHAEKRIAREAFDAAFDAALTDAVAAFKIKAAAAVTASDLWAIEDHLRQRRKDLEYLFDYRYSKLCFVFAQLIHLGHMSGESLVGLSEEKLKAIHDMCDRMKRM